MVARTKKNLTSEQKKNGANYVKTIKGFGLTQVEAARFLGINERTSRRYASGLWPAPRAVNILFSIMRKRRISAERAERYAGLL
jgi:hypothetical protein